MVRAAKAGRTQIRRKETRIRLLQAAYQLMSTKGVDLTSIQEITDTAGVGFGTFYNYFSSKDEIASQVLACTIHNLGQRNDLANRQSKVADPVLVVSNSVRLVAREMLRDPMWRWWVKRPDLMVERMRAGFKAFALRDIRRAVDTDAFNLLADDFEGAWSDLIWLLAGTIKDILDGMRPETAESHMAESVMRIMGVETSRARAAAHQRLPRYPSLPIDFSFALEPAV